MKRHYLDRLAEVIRTNWDQPALTDYATLDGGEGNSYTYGEMYGQIRALCDRFHQLGIQKGDHIAICGANSANWAVAYLAIAAYQAVSVTILHTLIPDEIVELIDFSDVVSLVVDKEVWQEVKGKSVDSLKSVILLEDFSVCVGTLANKKIDNTLLPVAFEYGSFDSLSQICYTSGTTGKPKGVMLTIRNISANVTFIKESFSQCPMINSLSFLPMSHAGIFVSDILHLLCRGANIHIFSSIVSPSELIAAYAKIKPQVVVMVPMMIDKLIASMQPISDWDMFRNRINSLFGNALEMFCLGGAKLSEETEDILLRAKLPFAHSYGTTECSPFISLMMPTNIKARTVGKVCPNLECRIADNGEILVRGENVMLGYYKDPEATAAKIDKDGWLHTGDRGHLDDEGYLYVEGRLEQDMVVLPSGENISLPNVESIINQVDGVEESLVLVRNGHLVALVYASANLNRQDLLRTINPQLPSFSQLYDLEFVSVPFQRTEKRTIKRYLYQ